MKLNEDENKAEVIRQKIINYHFSNGNKNIEEFVVMELNILPHAVSWIGRNNIGHSLLYRLVNSMPSLLEYGSRKKKA